MLAQKSRTFMVRLAAGLFAILCLLATALFAQTSTSIISGTVTDSSGAVVAGAKVDVKNVGTGITISLTSDAQGRFRAPDVQIGDYEVQASQAGFQTVVRKGISTTVGGQAIVDITLPVGQAQQVVTVDAQVSQVDTTSSAIGNTVSRTQIEELPMGTRNQTQLLALAPGVGYSAPVGSSNYGKQENYSISGSRANGILFLIDNTNLQTYNGHSTGSAATGATLGLEAIGDYQALTNTYSAQFGGNGGLVNAASKAGTNNFHGSLYFYLQNSGLLATRNTFDATSAPPANRQGIFGGSLGGPIRKNKAFFFANYEGVRQGGSRSVTLNNLPDANAHLGLLPCNVAGASYTCGANNLANVGFAPNTQAIMNLYPLPSILPATPTGYGNLILAPSSHSQDDYLLTRFDYTFSGKDSLFVRYVRDTALAVTLEPNPEVPLVPEGDQTLNHFVTIEEDHVISPSLVNLGRVSFLRPYESANATTPPVPALQAVNTVGGSQNYVTINGNPVGAWQLLPWRLAEQNYQAMDDVIWTHGAHSVKFGATFAVVADFTNQNNTGAAWTFPSVLSFLQGAPSSLAGGLPNLPGQAPNLANLDNYRDAVQKQFMPYVNDEWKITRRLTLNLGVRYEWMSNPGIRHDLATNITNLATNTNYVPVPTVMPNNPTNKNFAPRIGFAFDPFKDHKTSIRGGFGMFYNELTAHIWLDTYWTQLPYVSATVTNPSWPVPFSGGATPPLPTAGQFGLSWLQVMHTPYMMQYNMSVQREVAKGTIVTLAYVGSKGVHLISQSDYNFPLLINGVYGTPQASGIALGNPRPNPAFGYLDLRSTYAYSKYNSLQTSVNRRFADHFLIQAAYTYQRSMDIGSGDQGPDNGNGGNQVAMNPFNTQLEYARSNFNFAQVLKINGVYELPFTRNELVKGWRLSGIFTGQAGQPFSVFDGIDRTGVSGPKSNPARPNWNGTCDGNTINGAVTSWYNASCYTIQPIGTFGNLGRNTLTGPGLETINLALLKRTAITKISENFVLEFRAEVNDALNRANYALPNNSLFQAGSGATAANGYFNSANMMNANAGRITATIGGAGIGNRQVIMALKATF
jgi:Carboxypeptidase regulatory-like domain/TonB dependent receptor/TonB-dependent Receptor Plug Domain